MISYQTILGNFHYYIPGISGGPQPFPTKTCKAVRQGLQAIGFRCHGKLITEGPASGCIITMGFENRDRWQRGQEVIELIDFEHYCP